MGAPAEANATSPNESQQPPPEPAAPPQALDTTAPHGTAEQTDQTAPPLASATDASPPRDATPSVVSTSVEVTSDEAATLSEARLAATHPRRHIRHFLRRLFAMLGVPLPASWPEVDLITYGAHVQALRERLDQLYTYLDSQQQWTIDQRLMPRYIGETAIYLCQIDYEQPEARHDPPQSLVETLADRPKAIIDYDQLYCTPDSTARRVTRILRDFGDSDARILFLGDDDLGSVALAHHPDGFHGEIHMIDLDDRLHEYIARKAPHVIRHKADFILKGIDPALCESFDAVVLDPPWDFYRLWCFLDKAIYCLKQSPHARIYLSYCPLVLEHRQKMMAQFQARVASRYLTFDSIETAFSLYSLSPDELPDLQTRLDPLLPPMDSPFLDLLRELPYVHTQLYTLRRLPYVSMGPVRRALFRWWNRA